MFSLLRGKSKKSEVTESIFPPANVTFRETSKVWVTKTDEEILSSIKESQNEGKTYAVFFNSRISKETKRRLKQQGYSIDEGYDFDAPKFEVSW